MDEVLIARGSVMKDAAIHRQEGEVHCGYSVA